MNEDDEPLTSQEWLHKILEEQYKITSLLGKTSPGKMFKPKQIEYESLLIDTTDSIKHYNYRQCSNGNNNNDKCSYKNINMWSSKSVTLEKLLKPIVNTDVIHTWPDFETLSRISSYQGTDSYTSTHVNDMNKRTEEMENMNISVVNTLTMHVEEALEVRYSIDHIHSPRSHHTNTFRLVKESVDKIEFDILVLSIVNDYYNTIETRKEQEKLKKEMLSTRTSSSFRSNIPGQGANWSTNTTITPYYTTSNTSATTTRKVRLEHQVRTTAVLLALSADKHVHIRPLCTSSDVLLALYELLDPNIFLYGCIQLPHILPDGFNAHMNGFYRYIYQLNQPGIWQYIQIQLSSKYKSLSGFIYPSLIHKQGIYTIENIPEGMVSSALQQASYKIVRTIQELYGKAKLLLKLVVDFEAVLERASSSTAATAAVATSTSSYTSMNKYSNSVTAVTDSSVATSPVLNPTIPTSGCGVGGATSMHPSPRKRCTTTIATSSSNTSKDSVLAPHLVTKSSPSDEVYHYRLLHIVESDFGTFLSGQRRDAVCSMPSAYKVYLRNYEYYFQEQWEKLKKEYIHQQALSCAQKTGIITLNNSIHDDNNSETDDNNYNNSRHSMKKPKIKKIFKNKRKNGPNASAVLNIEGTQKQATEDANSFFYSYYTLKNDYYDNNTTSTAATSATTEYVDTDNEYVDHTNNNKNKRKNFIFTDSENDTSSSDSSSSSYNSTSSSSTSSHRYSKYGECDTNITAQLIPSTIFSFLNKRKNGDFQRKLKQTILIPATTTSANSSGSSSNNTTTLTGKHNTTTCSTIKPTGYHGTSVHNPNPVSIFPTHIASTKAVDSHTASAATKSSSTKHLDDSNTNNIGRYYNKHTMLKKTDREMLADYHISHLQHQQQLTEAEERANLGAERVRRVARVRTMVGNEYDSSTGSERVVAGAGGGCGSHVNAYDLYFKTRTCTKKKAKKKGSSGRRSTAAAAAHSQQQQQKEEYGLALASPSILSGPSTATNTTSTNTTSTNPYILRNQVNRDLANTLTQQQREASRHCGTQALDIEHMHTHDAHSIYTQDDQVYRELMNIAAIDYIQQHDVSQKHASNMNISYINNASLIDTTYNMMINKNLYFASNKQHLYDHALQSPYKPNRAIQSPIQLYQELNKTHSLDKEILIKPKVSHRNDEGFNARAAELAERLELTELFTVFDPAVYSSNRDIVLLDNTSSSSSDSSSSSRDMHSLKLKREEQQQLLSEDLREATPISIPTTTTASATTASAHQQSYVEYMKEIYDHEMNTMLNNLITHLPPSLATKVRTALQKKQEKMKLEKRKKYIQRRRKQEIIKTKEINELAEYYNKQKYIITNDSSDSSSSEKESNNKNKRKNELNVLLGEEFLHIDTEHMEHIIITRALEEEEELRKKEKMKEK